MKSKKWIFALLFGIAASGLHLAYVRGLENKKLGGDLVSVLAISKQVKAGDKVNKDFLGVRKIPAAYVEQQAVLAEKIDEIDGLTAVLDMEPSQIVEWTDFSRRFNAQDNDLAAVVESGKRAVTISVDKSLSMGGLLKPGHRVDIVGTFAPKGSVASTDRVSATILQNILVLATGASVIAEENSEAEQKYSTATLSMSLEEAELIALATSSGKLSLVLRGRQDLAVERDVPEKKMEDVWDADRRAALQQNSKSSSNQRIERLIAN